MPLSRDDCAAILRQLQVELRKLDPELHAVVAEHTEVRNDSRRQLS